MNDRLYFDSNASTRPADEVVEEMARNLRETWGNPSSVHRVGGEAKRVIELARESVARLVGCQERELVFTSGASESIAVAIRGSMEHFANHSSTRRVFVTTRFEHSAVREVAQHFERSGHEVVWLRGAGDDSGTPDLDALSELLDARADEIALVSLMWANNETGALSDVARAGRLCREHGVRFHSDATQWVGKMPTDFAALEFDLASFSPHKFHGPKGVGALYARRGTENVAGIVGFGVAADLAARWLATEGLALGTVMRDEFERAVVGATGAVVHSAEGARLWNTTNLAFAKLEAEAILLLLSERGMFVSAGAACASGSLDPSPILLAMGVPAELAHGSIRFSISRETTTAQCARAVEIVTQAIAKLRASSASAIGG